MEIHYCNRPVLEISQDLNVESLVLWFLFSFREYPWWVLVCYVIVITTTGRGYCVTYYRFTINIATVSYQYLSFLFLSQDTPAEVHLLILYLYLSYKQYFFIFICNLCRTLIYSQISNQFLCDIFKQKFSLKTNKSTTYQKLWLPLHSKHLKMERYQGWEDCCGGDRNSDINFPDSDNLWQYTTVTN